MLLCRLGDCRFSVWSVFYACKPGFLIHEMSCVTETCARKWRLRRCIRAYFLSGLSKENVLKLFQDLNNGHPPSEMDVEWCAKPEYFGLAISSTRDGCVAEPIHPVVVSTSSPCQAEASPVRERLIVITCL